MIVALCPVRDLKRYYMDLEDRIDIWHVVAKEVAPPRPPPASTLKRLDFLHISQLTFQKTASPPSSPTLRAQTQVAKELQKRCAAGLKENF